jgi:hypothetical protein
VLPLLLLLGNVVKLRPLFTPEPPKPGWRGGSVVYGRNETRTVVLRETHNQIVVPKIPLPESRATELNFFAEQGAHIIDPEKAKDDEALQAASFRTLR